MSGNYGWIELVFVGAVALGLGVWQLWSVSREIRRDRAKKENDQGSSTAMNID